MKILTSALLGSLLITAPAWANHHQQQAQNTPVHSLEMIKTRFPMAQMRILEMQMLAKRSVEMMQHAQKLTEQAQQNKNLATAHLAMTAFLAGRELHQENMEMMRQLQHHLAQHVAEHHSGQVVLEAALLQEIQKSVSELGKYIQSHQDYCQKNQKPLNQKMRKQLIALGNEHFEKAQAAGDTQAMLQALQLLNIKPGN
jgi:hypothetical protein